MNKINLSEAKMISSYLIKTKTQKCARVSPFEII